MIARATGEVDFQDGLHIGPDEPIGPILASYCGVEERTSVELPIAGWQQHRLGRHRSAFGTFEVETISGPAGRVHLVFLAHVHSFYEKGTPDDSERRAFHEGIIATELGGQREFAWGEVFQRLERDASKDWLIVSYAKGPHVPQQNIAKLLELHMRAPEPDACE